MRRWLLGACVIVAGCGPVAQPHRGAHAHAIVPEDPDGDLPGFQIFGDAAPIGEIALTSERPYRYGVHREDAGTTADLHGVAADGEQVFAVGDGGLVLRRDKTSPWKREPTPTTRRLESVVAAGDVYAVGEAGTVLHRTPDGSWRVEPAPTTVTLHAITKLDHTYYAVGEHGTLIAKSDRGDPSAQVNHDGRPMERVAPDVWKSVATHSEADLHHFDGNVAIGGGGAIVDCVYWDREQRDEARELACVPRPSPTTTDLLTATDPMSAQPWRAFGAHGVVLGRQAVTERFTPIAAALLLPLALAGVESPTITATAINNWGSSVGHLATILAGSGGVLAFLAVRVPAGTPPAPPVTFVLPDHVDLSDVATTALDSFAVGSHGTILHLQTIGVYLPRVFAM